MRCDLMTRTETCRPGDCIPDHPLMHRKGTSWDSRGRRTIEDRPTTARRWGGCVQDERDRDQGVKRDVFSLGLAMGSIGRKDADGREQRGLRGEKKKGGWGWLCALKLATFPSKGGGGGGKGGREGKRRKMVKRWERGVSRFGHT